VLARPQHTDVARLVEPAVPGLALVERLQLVPGRVGLEPVPRFRAELPVLRRVVQVHRSASAVRATGRRGAGAPPAEVRLLNTVCAQAVAGLSPRRPRCAY